MHFMNKCFFKQRCLCHGYPHFFFTIPCEVLFARLSYHVLRSLPSHLKLPLSFPSPPPQQRPHTSDWRENKHLDLHSCSLFPPLFLFRNSCRMHHHRTCSNTCIFVFINLFWCVPLKCKLPENKHFVLYCVSARGCKRQRCLRCFLNEFIPYLPT